MSTIFDAIETFVGLLVPGSLPLPPNPDTLAGHVPNLNGLARDDAGIICQVQEHSNPYSIYNSKDTVTFSAGIPLAKLTPLDGGDSAHRTGVAAFCNSASDQELLHLFFENNRGIMVRHPTQIPFNFDYWDELFS
jgi:hypothetical protein